jgi:uncharacterized protein YdaU (DUF1376 family)
MNYYEHHLGDYAEATAHLSFVEDAAYSRCIRKYYATEAPLPTDPKAVQRLIGARSKEEREAVETVLQEFFALDSDGWHNRRCDEEIARYKDKQSKAKRSADARWNPQRPDSEGNANASKPECERIPDAMQTQSEGNALQSPVSSPQAPIKNSSLRSESARASDPGVGMVFEHWQRTWNHHGTKLDPKRRKRIEARLKDFTPEQLCDAISGFRNSPWHLGTDPKGQGVVYDSLDTLLRDSAQVETGLRLLAHPPRPPPKAETPTERILRKLNGTDDSRVIEHEPDEPQYLPSY